MIDLLVTLLSLGMLIIVIAAYVSHGKATKKMLKREFSSSTIEAHLERKL